MKKAGTTQHLMIVLGCMLLQAVPFAFAAEVSPLFVHYLHANFNFSIASVGFIFTVGAIASSLASPFLGRLYDKFSTRLVMVFGLIFSSIGMFMNALSTQLWQFFVANAIIQIGVFLYSSLGIPFLIGQYFTPAQKPKALGVAFSGGAMGNFVLQFLVSRWLSEYTIHFVYFLCASIALVAGLLILFFLIRSKTQPAARQSHSASTVDVEKGLGVKKTLQLPLFWILSCGMLFIGLNVAAQSSQYANYFNSLQFDPVIVGTIGSTFAIFSLVGNIGGGFVVAKIGLLRAAIVAGVLQFCSATSMLLIVQLHLPYLAYSWAICYGLSVYIYMSGPALIIQTLFGMKESSAILGVFSIFFAVGFASGSVIFGLFVDVLGFKIAWLSVIVYILIGFTILITMIARIRKRKYAGIEAA